jgi:hypothetical protein
MANPVKLTNADNNYLLSFPKNSNGKILFFEYLKLKAHHFKGKLTFVICPESKDSDSDVVVIQLYWLRVIAQECQHFIRKNFRNVSEIEVIEPNKPL